VRRRRRLAAGAATVAALTAALLGTAAPAQAAGTVHGCPSGAVCIYPRGAGWNGGNPSVEMWSYGPHNLSNQYGHHYVLNNQHDDGGFPVIAILCKGYDGKDCSGPTYYQYSRDSTKGVSWGNPDLTPINSVILTVFSP
jgi:hypothetical protein